MIWVERVVAGGRPADVLNALCDMPQCENRRRAFVVAWHLACPELKEAMMAYMLSTRVGSTRVEELATITEFGLQMRAGWAFNPKTETTICPVHNN